MSDRFEAIYRAEHSAVYRQCLALLGNPEDAAEATQEVFSRLLHHMVELDNPGAWLHRVAHNHCMNRLRSRRREVGEPREGCAAADPERQALTRMALARAFAALTPRERRALTRSTLLDRSVGSVARDMDMSYMGAAQLLSRARRRAAAVAATVVSLAGSLVARRAERPPGGVLSGLRGQAMVAVAAVLVVGGTAAHFQGSDPARGAVSMPPPQAVQVVTPSPPPTASGPAGTQTPGGTQRPVAAAGAQRSAPPIGAATHATPTPAPGPSGTPAPVIVSAGGVQCGADPGSVDLGSCAPH